MKSLLEIFQVTEAYRLPDKIMDALLSDEAENVVKEIKENARCDMRDMFQQEQGDRKNLKQDFTPDCICDMVAKLMKSGSVLDMCSGTGALSKADYGFVLRGLEHLNDGGRLIAILPHGVLFRGAGEGKIREWLIKEHLINAVIGLPDKLFLNTGIPVCLLILEKESSDVLFVDASKEFVKKAAQNDMTAEQIQKTADAFNDRSEKERFAHVSGYKEIESNDYNLNIPRYVDTFVPEPLPNITELLRDLREIDAEERQIKGLLYEMLGQLTGGDNENDVVRQHRQILKPQMRRTQSEQITMGDLYENIV